MSGAGEAQQHANERTSMDGCALALSESAAVRRALEETGRDVSVLRDNQGRAGLASAMESRYSELQQRLFELFHVRDSGAEHSERRAFLDSTVYADDSSLEFHRERFYLAPHVAQLGVWAASVDPECEPVSTAPGCDPEVWRARSAPDRQPPTACLD